MKLSEYKQTYYEFSGKASDVARGLAFAGIAIVWVFKKGTDAPTLAHDLLVPTTLFAVALACDLLQYVSGSVIWGLFQWMQERKLADPRKDPDLDSPSWLKWPITFFFTAKLVVIGVAYYRLIEFLLHSLFGR